ncbi:hypothetical protein ABI_34900 [Asticcacaulis biprosthecium C19]|uniref:Uncharacterized protein n=1 Tax=Asticcacaulis biprosthecium C19 TaxID=715226 RepID=F4QQI1_9CAUL|nr:hypothetical protein ABI_34900 [Asticcacaulis biprosthecium C19]
MKHRSLVHCNNIRTCRKAFDYNGLPRFLALKLVSTFGTVRPNQKARG